MPIFWTRNGVETLSHVGLVMEPMGIKQHFDPISYTSSRKTSVLVWNPESQSPETIWSEDSNGILLTGAVVDIAPEILASWSFKSRFLDVLAGIEQNEKLAQQTLQVPKIGSHVIVRRGRKVPFGTKGVVFWEGTSASGPRIGFKSHAEGEEITYWTPATNVDVTTPGLNIGQIPDIGWLAFLEQTNREESLNSLNIHKGDRVKLNASGKEGKVFWAKGRRLGVNVGETAPIWTETGEVKVFRNGTWISEARFPCEASPLKSLFLDPYLVKDFPEPFNAITYLEIGDDGSAQAFTEEGDVVVTLPTSEVHNFWKKTAALKKIQEEEVFNSFVDGLEGGK